MSYSTEGDSLRENSPNQFAIWPNKGYLLYNTRYLNHMVCFNQRDPRSQWTQVHRYVFRRIIHRSVKGYDGVFAVRVFSCDRDSACPAKVYVFCWTCRVRSHDQLPCNGQCARNMRVVIHYRFHIFVSEFIQIRATKKDKVTGRRIPALLRKRAHGNGQPPLRRVLIQRPTTEFFVGGSRILHRYVPLSHNRSHFIRGRLVPNVSEWRCVHPDCSASVLQYRVRKDAVDPTRPLPASQLVNRIGLKDQVYEYSYKLVDGVGSHTCGQHGRQ